MIVRREQGFGRDIAVIVQEFGHRPGDTDAVKSRGATTDLVQHNQAPGGRMIEDIGGLGHFHHKGRLATGEVVAGADPGEYTIDDADFGFAGRYH